MKKIIAYIRILFICAANIVLANNLPNPTFVVKKGTNVSNWLSQSNFRGNLRANFFTEADVINIKSLGFDHIRLPIDEEQLWDEDGLREEEAFDLLDNALSWCQTHNLKVIVDLHILRSHHFNAKEKPLWTDKAEQAKFFDLWKQLSATLRKFPNDMVAYELMNEAVAEDSEQWNNLLNEAIKEIRKIEPERTIVVGSNKWQSVDTFKDLKVPANDPNILLSFHYYEPFLFTHYKTSWTHIKDYKGTVQYPGVIVPKEALDKLEGESKKVAESWAGKSFDAAFFQKHMQQAIDKAKELNLNLYCGEFGVYHSTPEKDRLQWLKDLVAVFEKNNIAYANWNYKSKEFGIIDDENSKNEKMISILSYD